MLRISAFDEALRAAGIPIDGVSGVPGPSVRIDFRPEATREQRQQANDLAQAFDWSEPTPAQERRQKAKTALQSLPDPLSLLVKALALELIEALRAERQAYAALRADVIAGRSGGAVTAPPLAVPTVQQAVDAILSRVDTLTS